MCLENQGVMSTRWILCGVLSLGIGVVGCARRPSAPLGELQIRPQEVHATTAAQAVLRTPGRSPDSLHILWLRNGTPVATGPRLPPGRVRRGDTLRAQALLFFGERPETLLSSPVIVANSPPVVRSLRFRPDPPHPDSALRAVVEAWDPDGDPIRLRFRWWVNGKEVSGDSLLLPGSFRGGTRITLQVVPSDPVGAGKAAVYEGVALNRPPRFVGTERPTRKGDTLWIPIRVEDPDGDSVTLKLVEAPPGFHLDTERGVIWGVLRGGAIIRIEARDPHGGKAWYQVNLEEVP